MKWSSPFFDYHGTLCHMVAFKAHASFGFWKGALVMGPKSEEDTARGQYGRLTSVKDLPSKKALTADIKKAMKLNEEGVSVPKVKKPKADVPVPSELAAALAKNKKARTTFEAFSPSHRRDYNEWIGEAKGEDTRARRVKQAIEWIAEGKARNWKYERR